MPKLARVIVDDAELERAHKELVKISLLLSDNKDPYEEPEDTKKREQMYNRIANMITYYKRGRTVQEYPQKAEEYDRLGWSYQKFSEPLTS